MHGGAGVEQLRSTKETKRQRENGGAESNAALAPSYPPFQHLSCYQLCLLLFYKALQLEKEMKKCYY